MRPKNKKSRRLGYGNLRGAGREPRCDAMSETMRSAVLYSVDEPMRLVDLPVPTPRPTDVLIKVKACGIVPNLGNVLKHWQGWFPELPLPKLPASFGLDVAGEIAACGSHVQELKVGQRVYVTPGLYCGSCPACRANDTINCTNFTFRGYFGFGPDSQKQFDAYPHGGLSEYITAPQANIIPIPDNISFTKAARFGYLGTAYAALRKAEAGPGKTILINGMTGVLGLGAVLICLGLGVTRILGTARDRERLAKVKALAPGRIECLALGDNINVAQWANGLVGGHGVDAVIDCLGPGSSGELMMNAIYALKRGGIAVNVGGVGEKTLMDIHWMMDQQIAFIGSNWFPASDGWALSEMARAGTLDLSVFNDVTFPLAEINRVLESNQFRDGGFTNLVIVP